MKTAAKAREAAVRNNPLAKIRERFGTRMVSGCGHRCLICSSIVARGGPCPGLLPSDKDATPLCHVHFRTGVRACGDPEAPRCIGSVRDREDAA